MPVASRPVGAPEAGSRQPHVGAQHYDSKTQQHGCQSKAADPNGRRHAGGSTDMRKLEQLLQILQQAFWVVASVVAHHEVAERIDDKE